VQFEEETEKFPMVYSKFQEGILSMEGSNRERISSDEKIKSLKILYDSNAPRKYWEDKEVSIL